jgi:hypothetical protein
MIELQKTPNTVADVENGEPSFFLGDFCPHCYYCRKLLRRLLPAIILSSVIFVNLIKSRSSLAD